MLKLTVYYIKLIVIIICDLIYRLKKYLLYIHHGKHEFERICLESCDIYEKTMKLEQWLVRTNCETIRDFWETNAYYKTADSLCQPQQTISTILQHFHTHVDAPSKAIKRNKNTRSRSTIADERAFINLEDGDVLLARVLADTTDKFIKTIKHSKKTKLAPKIEMVLRDALYRIVSYNISLMVMLRVAALPYNPAIDSHTTKLASLWNNLVKLDKNRLNVGDMGSGVLPDEIRLEIRKSDEIVSNRWSHIGFQGEDPGTDFRGMGLLGLEQLEYLSRRSSYLALDLLKRSLNEENEYPFAIVGINITYNLVNLFKDGSMKHFYFDSGDALFRNEQRSLNLIRVFNDLYVELFLRFDCFWHVSKPENIFAFRELMKKFISVIKMDLCNRTFSFKFIY